MNIAAMSVLVVFVAAFLSGACATVFAGIVIGQWLIDPLQVCVEQARTENWWKWWAFVCSIGFAALAVAVGMNP